jgi:hypothetical protein
MLDPVTVQQQEALGLAGVNLVYGAFYYADDPTHLIASLMDDLSRRRIEVDMIKFSGPAFAQVDNRLMSLQLVEQGLPTPPCSPPMARWCSRPKCSITNRS